eukprot:TRINITY_DN5165_c0_g1_i1.p1 TRINITY_DN5165_c0_g1~~TRINITY_DN5165_c0_g1_i1.p1  ORF type:complete len:326 (+),score=40.56 TRINITY_DN5165_c0_g1_i1:178-1155(+)
MDSRNETWLNMPGQGYYPGDDASQMYGSIDPGKTLGTRPRRMLNFFPIIKCILVPCIIFVGLFWVLSFKVNYLHPTLATCCIAFGALYVMCLLFMAIDKWSRRLANPNEEPTWYAFLFLSCLVAFILALTQGSSNFQTNMGPYYDMVNLNSYWNVDPVSARGAQYMDAGRMIFSQGSHLDISKSMGFKSKHTYCVAPVSLNGLNASGQVVYDFWAVGKDCCHGSQGGDFQCAGYNDRYARGGLRLMNDKDRPYFRLAVQQAEAAYNIQAIHPIFFYWMHDPMQEVDSYKNAGYSFFTTWSFGFCGAQFVLVFLALLVFSRIRDQD